MSQQVAAKHEDDPSLRALEVVIAIAKESRPHVVLKQIVKQCSGEQDREEVHYINEKLLGADAHNLSFADARSAFFMRRISLLVTNVFAPPTLPCFRFRRNGSAARGRSGSP